MIGILAALLATVTATTNQVAYNCDGSTAVFNVTYPYLNQTDLVVTSTTPGGVVSTLALTTDYTLSVSSTSTTATLTLLSPATKCPSGNTLQITRKLALTQPTSFRSQLNFQPATHETAYDRLEMQLQQLSTPSPAGVINASSLITVPVGAPSAVPRTLGSKLGDVVSVKDFGAVGDGVTDDTAAIQAALNYAGAQTQKGTVLLPIGYYQITAALSLPNQVNLVGQGVRSQINQKSITANGISAISTANNLIADLHLSAEATVGAGPQGGTSSGSGVFLNHVTTPILRNVWVSGYSGGAFVFDDTTELRAFGCVSDQAQGAAGFVVKTFSRGMQLVDCVVANVVGYGFDIQGGYTFGLTGCAVMSTTGAGGRSGFHINGAQGLTITNATASLTQQHGFQIGDASATYDLTCIGCVADTIGQAVANTYDGFNIGASNRTTIVGDVYGGNNRYGVNASASANYLTLLGGHYEGTTAARNNASTSSASLAAESGNGSVTLAAGAGSAVVFQGCRPICTDTTAANAVRCSVSGTALSVVGTATDVINYFCF